MSALLCYPAYIASSLGRNSIDTHNHRRRGASLKYINLEMRLYLACAIINQRPPKRSRPRSIRGALTALSRARSSIVVTGFEWFFFDWGGAITVERQWGAFGFPTVGQSASASARAVGKSWHTHADFPPNKEGCLRFQFRLFAPSDCDREHGQENDWFTFRKEGLSSRTSMHHRELLANSH